VRVSSCNCVDIIASVGVVGGVEVSSALKSAVKRVLSRNNRLNRLYDFELLVCRKLLVSKALEISK
jgi:hypothetical protein